MRQICLLLLLLQSTLLQAQSNPPLSPKNQRTLDSMKDFIPNNKNEYILGSSARYHLEDSMIVVWFQSIHDDSGQLSDQQKLTLIMDTILKISIKRNISNIEYRPSNFYNKGWGISPPKTDSKNK